MAHTTLDSVVIRELIAKQIRNDTEIIMSSTGGTTDGWIWKDLDLMPLVRFDSSGNIHMKGDVFKDL